jgi:hypothetical protein
MSGRAIAWAGLALSLAVFATALLGRLSYPLLWQDEGETAVFARRVLEYGYPKVHGTRNVVYEFGFDVARGIDEHFDAYIGTTWGHFYFAAPAVALADRTGDLRTKTALMRLPFALAGAAGVGVALAGILPALRSQGARLSAASAHLLLATLCVALVLHLREVRYYSLVTLLSSSLFAVHAWHFAYRRIGFRAWSLSTALLLFLLYQTFYVGFFVFLGALALDRLAASREHSRSRRRCWREALAARRSCASPPSCLFFEQLETARASPPASSSAPRTTRETRSRSCATWRATSSWCRPSDWGIGLALRRLPAAKARSSCADVAPPGASSQILLTPNALVNAANPVLYGRYLVRALSLLNALVLLQVIHLGDGASVRAAHRRRCALGWRSSRSACSPPASSPRPQRWRGGFASSASRCGVRSTLRSPFSRSGTGNPAGW